MALLRHCYKMADRPQRTLIAKKRAMPVEEQTCEDQDVTIHLPVLRESS